MKTALFKRKKPQAMPGLLIHKKAEGEGFEPPETCASTVFKTAAFDHSAIPPVYASLSACAPDTISEISVVIAL